MREVLFRGKRISNSKWVEGFMYSQHFPLEFRDDFYIRCYDTDYLVIPETVGQFTGLTDKNGVRIFEGDIVRYAERRLGGEDVSVAFPVTFDEGGFCAHHYFLNNWLRNGLGGNTKLEGIEVIGNIHDNPELLKGGEDND